jgi:hypothetical protein
MPPRLLGFEFVFRGGGRPLKKPGLSMSDTASSERKSGSAWSPRRFGAYTCLGGAILLFLCGNLHAQQANQPSQTTQPAQKPASTDQKKPTALPQHKLGPLDISINWRNRVEDWDWFQAKSGNNSYVFDDSLLRIALSQQLNRFSWEVEVAQDAILGLPDDAVIAAPQGQLGLGGTYYAANGNHTENADAFAKQAFVQFNAAHEGSPKIGRFEFFDGTEVKPKDPTLATLVLTRLAHRLISNFGFAAVQRSFDGAEFSDNFGENNVTLFAARPTAGVFQVDGNGELDVDIYYGAFNRSFTTAHSASQLRVFSVGYVDHRTTILKTDNRPTAVRSADHDKIELATFGADYAGVYHTSSAGTFDLLGWAAVQGGSWGELTQRSSAFVGEAGWQLFSGRVKPWLSAGYSYGSGDGNPNGLTHGTFFQVLTTPRLYARFPFYNMMNNEDAYGTFSVQPISKLTLRSEVHSLRLANAADFWYTGGGAFQRNTFGYTGRPSNGSRSLANVLDFSADYQFNHYISATLYYGYAWGKSVVKALYPNDPNGQLLYLETNFHF